MFDYKNMPEPRSEMRMIPIEHFDISPKYPEYKGELVGEIVNTEEPTPHLSRKGGKRLSQHGRGDIVIMDISQQGWNKILEAFDGLKNPNIDDVKRAITSLDFIGWDKEGTGH